MRHRTRIADITAVLTAVARHYIVGRQVGPAWAAITLRSERRLLSNGWRRPVRARAADCEIAARRQRPKYGTLRVGFPVRSFMTNDYDLAETYLNKAKETGAIDMAWIWHHRMMITRTHGRA